jgi:hypothetical protein
MRMYISEGSRMYISEGSGRGCCCICGKPIKAGEKQLVTETYRSSGRAHVSCIIKED